jgi:phage protein D/phage baseplate assembly protein gpV
MALSQLLPEIYVPTFELVVGNKRLEPSIAKNILEIRVTEELTPPSQFSFRLNDPKLEFVQKEGGLFTEGTRVEISIGFVGNTRKMMVGEISAIAADFPSNGPATVEVQGFDLFHGLVRGTVYRKFGGEGSSTDSGLRDSDIVSRIASEMQLGFSVDETPIRTVPWVQDNKTNLAFLEELAKTNGYFVWVDAGILYFKSQPPPRPNPIRLERGKTLLSFSPRLSTAALVNAIEVRGWDPIQKQSFSARVERSRTEASELSKTALQQIGRGAGGLSQRVVTDARVSSVREAKTLADSLLRAQEETTITGTGSSIGQPDMRAGTKLELSSVGRFDGSYIVTQVTHTVGGSGYLTSFHVNSASGKSTSDLAELLSPSGGHDRGRTAGVIVGLVLDNKDEQGLGRLKIKYPGSSDDEIGHWARLVGLMAGGGRGTFFLPEKDDEVLVAFEQGDINRPYVLGALWNGKDKPPDTNADGKNNLRFIKSRSGHVVRFDDTDGSELIEIIDKSGNNKIVFDTAKNTIAIKSAQDVVIEAPNGKISLNAQSVDVKSSAETKVEAQTTMDLKATGTTTVKGATVNIN